MLNDYIGGGQIFLHKTRMFLQVFWKAFIFSVIIGILTSGIYHAKDFSSLNFRDFIAYRKAVFLKNIHPGLMEMRRAIGNHSSYMPNISMKINDNQEIIICANKVANDYFLQKNNAIILLKLEDFLFLTKYTSILTFILIFLIWTKIGDNLASETIISQSQKLLSAKEVRKILTKLKKASSITIGDMPLVKDSETRHFLVSGSTGSGKTNLVHNMLRSISKSNDPAILIDQTGEMIARYYTPSRGDIIINPFDVRSKIWDLFKDLKTRETIEKFAKILFGYARHSSGHNSDPFWEESAATIFTSTTLYLQNTKDPKISDLVTLLTQSDIKTLAKILKNTEASRFLEDESRTGSSVMSIVATYAKPLSYLRDIENTSQDHDYTSFSIADHFNNINQGNHPWLFLSTKPSARSLTLPLISCLAELALSELIDKGIAKNKKMWFVLDELPSLGRLPALSLLMTEGRKYGAAVIASLQSLNQLYDIYGNHKGSTIFGQFGTHFFFKNTEVSITKMISSMCGFETIMKHHKNISFGASELRDGVSYGETEKKKPVIQETDIASLASGECFALFPEPKVRLAKINVPYIEEENKNEGFIQLEKQSQGHVSAKKKRQKSYKFKDDLSHDKKQEPRIKVKLIN